jgi:hypothetical protein
VGENLIFDGPLLREAERVLRARPEQPAVTAAGAVAPTAAPFGTVPGGAEAAGRLGAWVETARTDLAVVTTEVANLADGTGRAAGLAEELEPVTTAIASEAQVSSGDAAIAAPLAAPAPDLEGN